MTERNPRRGRVTLADVAREAGVSIATVSVVMRGVPGASPANRARVTQVAQDLGYVPDARARVLRQERSHLLGVMFAVQEPFHADLVEGIYVAAANAGYDVVLSAVGATRPEAQAVDTLLADRCEALILLGPTSPKPRMIELAARLPVVVVARSVNDRNISGVHTADAKGVQLGVDHLVGLGHTRIANIDGGEAPGAAQRRRGYRDAMRRHGLTDRMQIVHGGINDDSGARAAQALLAMDAPPTGILAFNDRCARGALYFLYRSGLRVPDDVSVVGFDDAHLAGSQYVDLTTVRQDSRLMARLAVNEAIRRLDEAGSTTEASDIVIPPSLVVRGTTGPAPTT